MLLKKKGPDFPLSFKKRKSTHLPRDVKTADARMILSPKRVIRLKERNLIMLRNDLIVRNPLRLIEKEMGNIPSKGGFGAVLARAGVGKTALLVQLSLNSLLNNKNVLHISLNDPVKKVSLWYEEVFKHIAGQYKSNQINELREILISHRFIMTFNVESFSVPILEERLTDLMEQNVFTPQMIIIDGFPFDSAGRAPLSELKTLAERLSLRIWFTIRTHRHEEPDSEGIPVQLQNVEDLFNMAIQLQPEGKEIHIRAIQKDQESGAKPSLVLDPVTMLIAERR